MVSSHNNQRLPSEVQGNVPNDASRMQTVIKEGP